MERLSQAFSSFFPVSEQFEDLFRSEVLLCNERQQYLADLLQQLNNRSCSVDFETGTLSFGEGEFVIKNIQIISNYSKSENIWLWSWGNEDLARTPYAEEVQEDALKAKEFGERHDIPEFCSRTVTVDRMTALALAMSTVSVVGADAFYPIEVENGNIVFISIHDERVTLPSAENWRSFIIEFPKLISSVMDSYPMLIHDHIKMIVDYCSTRSEDTWEIERRAPKGAETTVEEIVNETSVVFHIETVVSVKDESSQPIATFCFDAHGRIRKIQINLATPANTKIYFNENSPAR